MKFSNGRWNFNLNTPKYEIPTFGGKIGELRLTENNVNCYPLDELITYLKNNDYLACTFRGEEEINLVRTLNDLGFKFVASYRFFRCYYYEFTPVDAFIDGLTIRTASESDYDAILDIESRVFDYSTYQIDPYFRKDVTAHRNVLRVKSYFTNPNHVCYVAKLNDVVVGFIQFLIDKETGVAENVNSAILPEHHGKHIGAVLYAKGFEKAFDAGAKVTTGGVCVQNPRPFKLLNRMGFKFTDQEIHLRWTK